MTRHRHDLLILLIALLISGCATTSSTTSDESVLDSRAIIPAAEEIQPVLNYIERTWTELTRSHGDLPAALPDPKVEHDPSRPWTLYISHKEDPEAVRAQLSRELGPEGMRRSDELSSLFYKGDRSMRESGFDPSNRFGPFSIDIIHYAPVGLNALLYKMEREAAEICRILGREDEGDRWLDRAAQRSDRMNRYLWDDERGMYFDYNFREDRRSDYEFGTTFYPLWVGQASREQARRTAQKLHLFEAPGGLLTSTNVTGSQWDAPFGWAPLQIIAVDGFRRYGFHSDANRVAAKWISLITKEFGEHNVIVEKYDVVQRESDVASGIQYGYSSNEIGFGWTNAVYLALLSAFD